MNKLTYFLEHGLALEVFDNHTQQRYGPYDHKARYGGPEQILVKNGYVKVHGTSFLPGDKIDAAYQYALKYLPDRGVAESLIDRLASLTDNELETWSTVLWAARDLVSRSEEVGAARVLGYIGDSAKWKPKLGEPHFELSRVEDALRSLRDLGLLPA